MRRILFVLTVAALVAAMMLTAAPAMANDLFDGNDLDHFGGVLNDNDVLDNGLFEHALFGNDRRGDLFDDDGLFDGGGPICHDADTERVFIRGAGFVCVDENDLDDLHFVDGNGGFLGFGGGIEQDSRSGGVRIGSNVS
jgi:hypothetical protein